MPHQPIDTQATGAAATLTIGDFADVLLVELLAQAGCPVCRLRARTARRYLEPILWESVNDRGFRARLSRARGFCPAHTREALSVDRDHGGGQLGASILFGALVRDRLAELNAIGARPDRGSRRALETARTAASCPVCAEVLKAEASARLRLIDRIADPDWAAALSEAHLCLPDLLELWILADRRGAETWQPVAAAQVARVTALLARLDGFAAHSAYNRQQEMTDSERRAADEAAAFLSGTID